MQFLAALFGGQENTLLNAAFALGAVLVWKANRGEYALEDTAMAEWLARDQAVAGHR